MQSPLSVGDGIALAAFFLSGYATWKTFKFNERQNELVESQDRLNKLLLEKETEEALNSKKADLGATFIKLGSSKYRLKIWNKGKASARNVSLEFPEGNECLIQSDIDSKFPLELLDTHQSVELIAAVAIGTRSKHPMRLIWNDEAGERNEKLVYPTL
ncbi:MULTISPECIES: hypothetical protein [Alcaligenaceae]|uniref:hypothetical protein n=1 Tax=Alcaligenaceae TaxID=506 RepID=UPI002925FD88|nr:MULTISPECIES: hypothetical protein [Alcaligenaceae]WPL82255.1 hypothetical protein SD446_05835 [Bordetella hinzii]BEG77680.1 hypothetical protein HBIAX_04770 [Achromobacter xylosoxidans]